MQGFRLRKCLKRESKLRTRVGTWWFICRTKLLIERLQLADVVDHILIPLRCIPIGNQPRVLIDHHALACPGHVIADPVTRPILTVGRKCQLIGRALGALARLPLGGISEI